jgi:hypothetical protein
MQETIFSISSGSKVYKRASNFFRKGQKSCRRNQILASGVQKFDVRGSKFDVGVQNFDVGGSKFDVGGSKF